MLFCKHLRELVYDADSFLEYLSYSIIKTKTMLQINMIFLSCFFMLFLGCSVSNHDPVNTEPVLTHVVLCWLKEPGNAEQRDRIIEMTETFRAIPGVRAARAGNPIMSDRDIVDDSFDVGIIIEVKDEAGLKKYLDHPIHQKAKKEVLLPLVDRVLVYDFAK